MKTIQEFYAWERSSRDTIDVKTIYIDIAEDLVAGILLSQIIYWFLPNRDGQSKLRIYKDNRWWLAKGREDWWEETRISAKQFDRAIKILEEKQIVCTHIYQFGGRTLKHVSLNEDILLAELNKHLGGKSRFDQKVNPELPKGEICFSPDDKSGLTQMSNPVSPVDVFPNSPKVESGFPLSEIPYTKSSSKKTLENTIKKDFQSFNQSPNDYPVELKTILENAELEAFEDNMRKIMAFAIEDLYFGIDSCNTSDYPLSIVRCRMHDINHPVLTLAWSNYSNVRINSGITNHRGYLAKCIWSALIESSINQELLVGDPEGSRGYIRIKQQIDQYINDNIDQNMIVNADSYQGLPFAKILSSTDNRRLIVFWDDKNKCIRQQPYVEQPE